MFKPTLVSSSRTLAALEEMVTFFSLPRRACLLHSGRVRFQDAAQCVLQLLAWHVGGGSSELLNARKLRNDVKRFVSQGLEIGDDTVGADAFSIARLPGVLLEFCQVDMSADDLSEFIGRVPKPPPPKRLDARKRPPSGPLPSSCPPLVDGAAAADHGTLVTTSVHVDRMREYSSYSETELQLACCHKDEEIEALKREVQNARRAKLHKDNACQQARMQLAAANVRSEQLFAELNLRPGARSISPIGGYSLAIKRSLGHASSHAILLAVAGDERNGGFSSHKVVTSYEMNTCVAQRLISKADHLEMTSAFSDHDSVEVISFAGDATNQEAIDKHNIFVSRCSRLVVALDDTDFEIQCQSTQSLCDLSIVSDGTAMTTLANTLGAMASVGCPTWRDRAAGDLCPRRISVYQVELDSAGDNKKMAKLVVQELEGIVSVMTCFTFCLMHQVQLAIKAMLGFLDAWTWDGLRLPSKYFTSVASVSHAWRSPGISSKLRVSAAQLFDECISKTIFGKCPGRCLRGRWGSIQDVEQIIAGAAMYIGKVFAAVFTKLVAKDDEEIAKESHKTDGRKPNKVGAEEDDAFKRNQRSYRSHSLTCATSALWLATVRISHIPKAPLCGFIFWMQKAKARCAESKEQARQAGKEFLGETPMSKLVAYKARDIFTEIMALAGDASVHTKWAPVWEVLPEDRRAEACNLILSLVLQACASWYHRVMMVVESWPYLLLLMVEAPAHVCCERRREVARLLAVTSDCCLRKLHSDVALKVKTVFATEIRISIDSGMCAPRLLAFLTAWRSRMAGQTQDVEGLISVLQVMTNRCPNMRLPLATSRLSIKCGMQITSLECASLHSRVKEEMSHDDNVQRFTPNVAPLFVPMHDPARACNHSRNACKTIVL